MLRKIFIGTMLMAALMLGVNHAQTNSPDGYYGNTASANISAELSLPISIFSGFGEMHFGGFMPGATPGTVVVPANPYQPRTATGGVTLVVAFDREIGEITVAGNPFADYALTIPSEPVSIKLNTNQAIQMTLSNITYFTASGELKLEDTGYQYVTFGGTLNVAADQLKGDYLGSFEITATYQ